MGFSSLKDNWIWNYNTQQEFVVATVKKVLQKKILPSFSHWFRWIKWVPLKVSFCCWRASLDRIATGDNLVKKKIQVVSNCPMCLMHQESVDHIFFNCSFAKLVWAQVWAWCKLPITSLNSMVDVCRAVEDWSYSRNQKDIILGVVYITIWSIWKSRNETVFSKKLGAVNQVFGGVKSLASLWCSSRNKVSQRFCEKAAGELGEDVTLYGVSLRLSVPGAIPSFSETGSAGKSTGMFGCSNRFQKLKDRGGLLLSFPIGCTSIREFDDDNSLPTPISSLIDTNWLLTISQGHKVDDSLLEFQGAGVSPVPLTVIPPDGPEDRWDPGVDVSEQSGNVPSSQGSFSLPVHQPGGGNVAG
ncbi:hypothetical protein SSX86_032693 [Deinandra increscens subsp. villosa]|uniref:Reverse transcriptase zinc-binding domain-containing protein n=1 Tax=Deinandra increscens subsp. villosa TaxID=3103831 RepID=A0AAP0GHH6_9ASTR